MTKLKGFEKAIQLAIKGGYNAQWDEYLDCVMISDGDGGYISDKDAILLDRKFWKCLQKERKWPPTKSWILIWHKFIDHLDSGKDVNSFFDSILK